MERLDFCSLLTILRRYISDDHNKSQVDLAYDLFAYFMSQEPSRDFYFDPGQVCRWMNGSAKISPRISSFYLHKENLPRLEQDMMQNILPLLYDSSMATQEVYGLLIQDSTISQKVKRCLSARFPCRTPRDEGAFLAAVLRFAMEREFVKRDPKQRKLVTSGSLSPVVCDMLLNATVPHPCRYFCGRALELQQLHALLLEHEKVFLCGIPGIGKSEVAKAYAKQHKSDYTNILYLHYTENLTKSIADWDFSDDMPGESEPERFHKHSRFLRTLKEDTLLIVDNFNVTEYQDPALSVVLSYRCRVLFTSRSRWNHHPSMELKEISDTQVLLDFMGHFYSQAHHDPSTLEQIIQVVHRHTLAVELAARLLETGILEPEVLLHKLQTEKVALDASDSIGITKDGHSKKATYYQHIHTLFSLFHLTAGEQEVMRALIFTPSSGIPVRILAHWLQLSDANIINDLMEQGWIQLLSGPMAALHPMVQEVAMADMRPSVTNCARLCSSLRNICLRHGEEVPYHKQLFQTILAITTTIQVDDPPTYLRFLEDAFPYMEKYQYTSGMEALTTSMSHLLDDPNLGTAADRALLLDYCAACQADPARALALEQKAVELLGDITPEHALLAANLHANLGGLFRKTGHLESARHHLETGIHLLEQFHLTSHHDSIIQIANYAAFLTDAGQPKTGLSALEKLSQQLRAQGRQISGDYAMVQESMGAICLCMGEISQANTHYQQALSMYQTVFAGEPDVIESKTQEILADYAQAGVVPDPRLLVQIQGGLRSCPGSYSVR